MFQSGIHLRDPAEEDCVWCQWLWESWHVLTAHVNLYWSQVLLCTFHKLFVAPPPPPATYSWRCDVGDQLSPRECQLKLTLYVVAAVFCLCTIDVCPNNGLKNVKLPFPILHCQYGSKGSDQWGRRLPHLLLAVIKLQIVSTHCCSLWLYIVMPSVRCFKTLVLFVDQILLPCFYCAGRCWSKHFCSTAISFSRVPFMQSFYRNLTSHLFATYSNHFVDSCIKQPAYISMLVAKMAMLVGSYKLNPGTNMFTVALGWDNKYIDATCLCLHSFSLHSLHVCCSPAFKILKQLPQGKLALLLLMY